MSAEQLTTLHCLEVFGWELKFVQMPLFQDPVPVIFDGSRKTFVILRADGSLDESPDLDIRHSSS